MVRISLAFIILISINVSAESYDRSYDWNLESMPVHSCSVLSQEANCLHQDVHIMIGGCQIECPLDQSAICTVGELDLNRCEVLISSQCSCQ